MSPLAGAVIVDGDVLTATLGEGPAHGILSINADGSYTYTPNANFHGSDSFSWTVSDGQGASTVVVATIEVAAVNDAPVTECGVPLAAKTLRLTSAGLISALSTPKPTHSR